MRKRNCLYFFLWLLRSAAKKVIYVFVHSQASHPGQTQVQAQFSAVLPQHSSFSAQWFALHCNKFHYARFFSVGICLQNLCIREIRTYAPRWQSQTHRQRQTMPPSSNYLCKMPLQFLNFLLSFDTPSHIQLFFIVTLKFATLLCEATTKF